MLFDEYATLAHSTALFPGSDDGTNFMYPALKLSGETGEVCEKLGKKMRKENRKTLIRSDFTQEEKELLALELGDILWYVSALSDQLGIPLVKIAEMNIDKLAGRKQRNVIIGEGDVR